METVKVPGSHVGRSRRKVMMAGIFLLLLIVGSVWILCYRGTATLRTASGNIFGTTYHIKYEYSRSLDDEILAELQRVDSSLSVFNPSSCISRINAGNTRCADAMLYEVLTKAQEVSKVTDGAFDVTVMPLVNAWGFGFKKGEMPGDAEIDSLRHLVGYQKIRLMSDSLVIKQDPRMMIDCGAIAKGYGVDRIARLLSQKGVRNYMVEIGGEVVTKGRNPEGHRWKIGVSKPTPAGTEGDEDLQTVIELENAAVATSGNYRNYYIKDGRRYAHTIDPASGRPVQHSLLSATVLAPDCATADAYATAFMVMGVEGAQRILKSHKELKAYLIYEDKQGKLRTLTIGHVPQE